MGQKSRVKGARAERELFKLIGKDLGIKIDRNLSQSRDGGFDTLVGIFSLEVKRGEKLSIGVWWAQTEEQALTSRKRPILFYRQNHMPWKAVLLAKDFLYVGTEFQLRNVVAIPAGSLIEIDLPMAVALLKRGLEWNKELSTGATSAAG